MTNIEIVSGSFLINTAIFFIYMVFLYSLLNIREYKRFIKVFNKNIDINYIKYFVYATGVGLIFSILTYFAEVGVLGLEKKFYIYIFFYFMLALIFKGKFLEKVILCLTFVFLVCTAEFLISITMSIIYKKITANLDEIGYEYFLSFILEILILGVAAYYVQRYLMGVRSYMQMPTYKNYQLALLCIIVILFTVISIFLGLETNEGYFNFIMLFILLTLLVIIINKIFKETIAYVQTLNNLTIVKTQLENYEGYKKLNESYINEMRKFKHDLNNNFLLLENLLENEEYSTAKDVLSNKLVELEKTIIVVETGDTLLDFILNQKLSYAKKLDVKIDFKVSITEEIRIYNNHLIAIVFNIRMCQVKILNLFKLYQFS